MTQVLAKKRAMHQVWTKSGKRVPVTVLWAGENVVVRTEDEKHALVGFEKVDAKKLNKPDAGLYKKAGISFGMKKVQKLEVEGEKKAGDQLKLSETFAIGDVVDVTGVSKGSGFTGVVKRHGFSGGPRTHGQSDRERAPGAIGNRTTPGRVFKGKRMAGRGGNKTVTVENLQIIHIDDTTGELWVSGPIAGAREGVVVVSKVMDGKFEGLHEMSAPKVEAKAEETVEAPVEEQVAVEPEVKTEEPAAEQPVADAPAETKETQEEK